MLQNLWNSVLYYFKRGPYWEEQQEEHWNLEPVNNLFWEETSDEYYGAFAGDTVRVRLCMSKGFGLDLQQKSMWLNVKLQSKEGLGFWGEVLDDVGVPPRAPAKGELIRVWPGNIARVRREDI